MEQAAEMARALMENNVPSISPLTATHLLHVEQKVREAYDNEDDVDTLCMLRVYADALKAVCNVSAIHQAAVIARFERIVGGN